MYSWASITISAGQKGRSVTFAIVCVSLMLVIASCGPNPKSQTENIEVVGVVLLSQLGVDAIPVGQATFVELTVSRAKDLMERPFGTDLGTCTVSRFGYDMGGDIVEAPNGARLSASNISLSVDGQPYADLRQASSGEYALVGASGPLPTAGLRLTMPANGSFPAFSDMAISTGQPPMLATGFDPDAIDVTTEFRWGAGHTGAAVLLIGSNNNVVFSCVADDALGLFTFPEETRDALTSAGFVTGNLETLGRLSMSSATDGGSAQLLVGTLRLASLGATE